LIASVFEVTGILFIRLLFHKTRFLMYLC